MKSLLLSIILFCLLMQHASRVNGKVHKKCKVIWGPCVPITKILASCHSALELQNVHTISMYEQFVLKCTSEGSQWSTRAPNISFPAKQAISTGFVASGHRDTSTTTNTMVDLKVLSFRESSYCS
jgi:hypothetical protein